MTTTPGPSAYLVPARPADVEVEARRSRFRCRLERVADEATAREVVEAARRRHWDAGHHCSAFVLGPDAGTARSSDDGEPAGSAGAPMLETLRGREVSDVVAVVSRWFGGTLLGVGVRAEDEGRAVMPGVPVPLARRLDHLPGRRLVSDPLQPAAEPRAPCLDLDVRGARGHEVGGRPGRSGHGHSPPHLRSAAYRRPRPP